MISVRIGDIIEIANHVDFSNGSYTVIGVGQRQYELPHDHENYIDIGEDSDNTEEDCIIDCTMDDCHRCKAENGFTCPGAVTLKENLENTLCAYFRNDHEDDDGSTYDKITGIIPEVVSIKRITRMEIKKDGSVFTGKPDIVYSRNE